MNDEADFIAAVEQGLRALSEGRVLSHEEVKARLLGVPPADPNTDKS